MINFASCVVVAALLTSPSISFAEVPAAAPAAFSPAVASTAPATLSTMMLRAGTQVPLRTLEELTTNGKRLKVGQRFNLEVAEPVTVQGQTIIPAGAVATGEVISVRNKGMWGKSGNIEARVLYVRVGDRQLRLSGSMNDKGATGTGGVVASVALIPVAGFFVTGTSAVIKTGAPVKAFLDEDVAVAVAPVAPLVVPATAPAPMLVPAAAPAPAATTKPIA